MPGTQVIATSPIMPRGRNKFFDSARARFRFARMQRLAVRLMEILVSYRRACSGSLNRRMLCTKSVDSEGSNRDDCCDKEYEEGAGKWSCWSVVT